ncbi:hypothetical protein QQ008_13185 [Fulvivirgaceae bacterium BMA10]|uniref:Uncharacterized protein n=1 Tax=Splendidivirga corallicola TaxID=3051826 RepID=A0ABT8KPJ8_9BACT|nr:hypothetical protein [Fulvivirgaceae bacterium BMA10]
MEAIKVVKEPFATLFFSILNYKRGDQCLIIYDETFNPYLNEMIGFFGKNKILASLIFVPFRQQLLFIENNRLPLGIKAALSEANIIVSVVSSADDTTIFRRLILKSRRNKDSRLGHITGIDDDLLEIIDTSNIHEIHRRSEIVAWILGQASEINITSFDSVGNKYELLIKKRKWIDEPVMSPGIIYKNSWGNPIPGESFICPDYKKINGQICINGSVPGYVIDKGDEIILTFKDGEMINWTTKNKIMSHFLEITENESRYYGDQNWNKFAELGIGLNESIYQLSGNMMIDEKMLNTIHIAIGNNEVFGFRIRSRNHHDMVIVNALLKVDNVDIFENGKLNFDIIKKIRKNIAYEKINITNNSMIRIFKSKIFVSKNSGVYLKIDKAERTSLVKIADKTYNELVEDFCRIKEGERQSYGSLIQKLSTKHDEKKIKKLIEIMMNYNIINCL